MRIDKQKFKKMTKKYQDKHLGKTRAVIMDKEAFERIMANSETDKIAIYFAEDDSDNNTIAVIGLNKQGSLVYDTAENLGGLCPPNCPKDDGE